MQLQHLYFYPSPFPSVMICIATQSLHPLVFVLFLHPIQPCLIHCIFLSFRWMYVKIWKRKCLEILLQSIRLTHNCCCMFQNYLRFLLHLDYPSIHLSLNSRNWKKVTRDTSSDQEIVMNGRVLSFCEILVCSKYNKCLISVVPCPCNFYKLMLYRKLDFFRW